MSSRLYKRRLDDVQRQLNQARESLNVLQAHEYDDLSRHVAVANAEMNRRAEEVRELVTARDELLRDWTPDDDNG